MATTVARNQTDVNNMSARDRLWDSLNYSYGQKREESDKAYDRAISQQDRQLLSRGMQRSSYGMQTLGNMRQQKVDAQNTIYDQQIADYENRLKDIEDTEWQQAFQQKQFDEGVRQFDTNLAFQKERAAAGDQQWKAEFDEGVRQNNKGSAYNYVMSILQGGGSPSDELLAQAGLSRADAELIRQQAVAANAGSSGGGGGSRGGSGGSNGSNNSNGSTGNTGLTFGDFMNNLAVSLGEITGGKSTTSTAGKTTTTKPTGFQLTNVNVQPTAKKTMTQLTLPKVDLKMQKK